MSGSVKPVISHDEKSVTGVGVAATVQSGPSNHSAVVFQSAGTTSAHVSTSTKVGDVSFKGSASVTSKGSYSVSGDVGFDF